jgi:hypothetical protein
MDEAVEDGIGKRRDTKLARRRIPIHRTHPNTHPSRQRSDEVCE